MFWLMMKLFFVEFNKRNGQNMVLVKWDLLRFLGKFLVLNIDMKNCYKFEFKLFWFLI